MIFAGLVLAQPVESNNDLICERVSDAQEIVRRLKDYELLRELDQIKDQRISNLEKEIELLKRESELKDRIIQIKDMEIEVTRRAVNDMKDISDRAIKLAEIGKPKTNWQTIGMMILSAIILGIGLGK